MTDQKKITQDDLFSYTRYRWLCNEHEQLRGRYRRFNLEALLDVAVTSVGGGARCCTKILKCIECQYNKTYNLTMDTGKEVVAKLPNPNAGSNFFLTASEVATRTFLREHLSIPIPAIYTWCSDARNVVGAEYIIEDLADGVPLGSLWSALTGEAQSDVLAEIVDIEAKLASVSFQKQGCVYFKEDLERRGMVVDDLVVICNSTQDSSVLTQYALGPSTHARLWEGERTQMNLDRGPWSYELDYIRAMGDNETQWTKAFARPRINCHRSINATELPEEYLKLLYKYRRLAPYLQPHDSSFSHIMTLSHGDLHLDNIFVDPKTRKITHIIDWQSTSVSALFRQGLFPRMINVAMSQSAESIAELSGSRLDSRNASTYLVSRYSELSRLKNSLKWTAHNDPSIRLRTKPVDLVTGAWARQDTFSFRHALIDIAAHWPELGEGECPIEFEKEELKAHETEMELLEGLGTILHQLNDKGLIPLGGMVLRENYERARAINCNFKEMFIDPAEDEARKVLHSMVWPYQDNWR